jgi:cytochrome c oxidase assembly protein subunit 15
VPSLRARLDRLRAVRISPRTYRSITALALVLLATIVVSGAAVRLTGSGLGCPTWPTCDKGSLVPQAATGDHAWIEFVNRLFTGAVSIAVALAVLGSRRLAERRRDLTLLSWGLVAGVVAQAVLGGIVVLVGVHPAAVAGHYLLSAVLVGAAVVLHHRAGQPIGPRRPAATPPLRRWSWAVVVLASLVLVSGTLVSGGGPNGGDEHATRFPFAVRSVTQVHTLFVWVLLITVLAVLERAQHGDASPRAAARGRFLIGAMVVQGGIGYLQYFTGIPAGLVGLHVLGSVVVWAAALRFHLGLTEPLPEADDAPAGDPVATV